MLIHNKDDIEFDTNSHVYWDALYYVKNNKILIKRSKKRRVTLVIIDFSYQRIPRFFFPCSGAKFLWWTWHDTDAPIRNKLLGVPIGNIFSQFKRID